MTVTFNRLQSNDRHRAGINHNPALASLAMSNANDGLADQSNTALKVGSCADTESLPTSLVQVNSKWLKSLVQVIGSIEAALVLSDSVIYYQNQYRSFTVDNAKKYGLLTSISEIQRNYKISYKRAKLVLASLIDQNLLEVHAQGFIHNQKFYTPTQKAINLLHQLKIEGKNSVNSCDQRDEVLLPIDQSTSPYRQKTYKDKNKDKKNNNQNNQKNYSLLENSTPTDCDFVSHQFSVDDHFNQATKNQLQVDWVNSVVSEQIISEKKPDTSTIAKTNVAFTHSPEKTVIFDFTDKGVGVFSADAIIPESHQTSITLADFSENQQQVVETIMTLFADQICANTFQSWLVRTDVKAKDFRALVSFAFKKAKGALALNALKSKLKKSTGISFEQKTQTQTHKATSIDTALVNRIDKEDIKTRIKKLVEAVDQKKSVATPSPVSVNTVDAISQPVVEPTVSDQVMAESSAETRGDGSLCDTVFVKFSNGFRGKSIAQGGHAKIKNKPSLSDYCSSDVLSQPYHSEQTQTQYQLKMPIIEKEILLKDWASLAEQNFYEDVLPDCQKIALVAVIDYVKRKGVVIGSDEEVYRWLYHAASNHRYYYSQAKNFKHLVNILIKALLARRFNKPSGFERWMRIISGQSRDTSRSYYQRE